MAGEPQPSPPAGVPARISLVRAAATVGSLTLLSRVLGFLRDAGIAAFLGAGAVADAFFVSFKLANLLRRLFAEGAFNAAFVPLFTRSLTTEGREAARRFAEEALSVLATALLLVVLAAELSMPWVVRVIAAGFEPEGERFRLAVELSRITFPYLALISLAGLFGGVLNAVGRFGAAAFAPVILNLVLIAALCLAAFHPETPARLLAWGVLIAGVLQLGMLARAAGKAGFGLRWRRPRRTRRVRRLLTLLLPGALGAGVYQINLVIDTWFASHLPQGAVSYLFYADRLTQLPLGLIGVALGTVLLPVMVRQLRAGDRLGAFEAQNRSLELALLLTLPAAGGLVLLAEPIIVVLFERGAFTAAATQATAGALAAFALGLPAYVLIKVLVPAFFAREDTRTPVVIAALCLLVNILLILLLIGCYAHVGIALATAAANWLNAALLALVLWRRRALAPDLRLRRRLPRMLGALLLMGVALHFARPWLEDVPDLPGLAALVLLGGAVFIASAQLIGAASLREIGSQLLAPRA